MLAMPNILAQTGGSFWLPPQASTVAPEIDNLFYGIYYLCVFFFLLIAVLLIYFAIKYRYREGVREHTDAPKHNTALELTWTFIPTVLVVVIFYYGFVDFLDLSVPPKYAATDVVQAQMWSYAFTYPNGLTDGELKIPINTPIVFHMSSSDVIHGFYIPAFRIKKDIVPMRDNVIWVQATQLGKFDIYCTQYCGKGHSEMRNTVEVLSEDDYQNYLLHAEDRFTPWQLGQRKYNTFCFVCHSLDGSANTGPTWKGIWGSTVTMEDGSTKKVDEAYLTHMITQPNVWKLQPPFDSRVMPLFNLSDRQVKAIIEFIKSPDKEIVPASTESATAPATQPAQ
jgi:cytochrome c oxidase subunit 2